jgi:Uma2 family endonuclease
MSAQLKYLEFYTPEEYLELEKQNTLKHEYCKGLIYAMAGAKKSHALIAHNLDRLLGNHLEHSPCLVYVSDMKVRIEVANCFYYPDLAVTCHKQDIEINNDFISNPILIIEVLSKSTEQFDRGNKFLDYQLLSSLQDYVLISQDKMFVECYHKQTTGDWIRKLYHRGEQMFIPSIEFICDVEHIYHKVLW